MKNSIHVIKNSHFFIAMSFGVATATEVTGLTLLKANCIAFSIGYEEQRLQLGQPDTQTQHYQK